VKRIWDAMHMNLILSQSQIRNAQRELLFA
jgi:hypothetical protein